MKPILERGSRCSNLGYTRRAKPPDKPVTSMQNRTLRIILTIFFIGLLATPFVIKRLSAGKEATTVSTNPSTALSRYGLSFQEVAHASGIDFTHTAPTLDPKLDHIMLQIASMGAAVSVVDFDRDG